MEIDDLKRAWQTLDRRLQREEHLLLADLRERRGRALRGSLRPLAFGQVLQMLFGIGAILIGVALWSSWSAIPTVFICGLVVHVYGVATVAAAGVVLGGIARIEPTLPVLELQLRLARLRRAYIVSGNVAGLPWWLLWMVPPIVTAALHGFEHGESGLQLWHWLALGSGLVGLAATFAFHRWLRRPGRESLAQRMEDSAAGSSLRRARAELEELLRIEAGEA